VGGAEKGTPADLDLGPSLGSGVGGGGFVGVGGGGGGQVGGGVVGGGGGVCLGCGGRWMLGGGGVCFVYLIRAGSLIGPPSSSVSPVENTGSPPPG